MDYIFNQCADNFVQATLLSEKKFIAKEKWEYKYEVPAAMHNLIKDGRPMTGAFPENVERLTGNMTAKPLIDLTVQRFNN